ncbi:MAG: hypothetical protein RSD74_02155 [Angelakisella sp.]
MTTPLFLLRCCEIGLNMTDLELLDFGLVVDMFTERSNDDYNYAKTATQEDFNKF